MPARGPKALAEFIDKHSSQVKFAREINCSASHLSLLLAGERSLSLTLAKRIAIATDGLVPMEAWVDE
jgi:hypothetical protein